MLHRLAGRCPKEVSLGLEQFAPKLELRCLRIRKKRPELRLIISSATIDAQAFSDYFNSNVDSDDRSKDDCAVISLEGRMYPVEISYLAEPTANYVQSAVDAIWAIHLHVSL